MEKSRKQVQALDASIEKVRFIVSQFQIDFLTSYPG